ncbi:hypothetical protein [Phenylobacterium conjunctum]|uniref:Lipoprotein n=1 Tax=Phenylobacterium conjunctum TaxID=1298959 RepID=A0ABW3T2U4_9CAUL
MKMILAISALALCAACASGPEPEGGVATYDNLKTARAACEAKGEALVLKTDGNPQRLSAYQCKRNGSQ